LEEGEDFIGKYLEVSHESTTQTAPTDEK
jgi:hypothetical protein